jgi:hypothetical protein
MNKRIVEKINFRRKRMRKSVKKEERHKLDASDI